MLRADIERFPRSEGFHSHGLKGLGIGAAARALTGLILQAVACEGGGELSACIDNGYVYFGLAGAGVGGLVGLVIGWAIRTETWSEVSLATLGGRLRLRPAAIAIRF